MVQKEHNGLSHSHSCQAWFADTQGDMCLMLYDFLISCKTG